MNRNLGAVTSHFDLFSSHLPFLAVRPWESTPFYGIKESCTKIGVCRRLWRQARFCRPSSYRRTDKTLPEGAFLKSHRCWAHERDVTIRLFRYPQAPYFIISYLIKKTGTNPVIKQSGSGNGYAGRISNQGNANLRRGVYNAGKKPFSSQ
ncbi:transposase [Clostridium sp. 1xD42-85]|uniref:transposase n=1 Tax=Clostridia TaxID=186801 RepID=UPI000EA0EB4D|nr:hypothetical protein [Roseburia sp. 1XD42-34]RKI75844.1 hypothetical protein D7V87_14995 [Clostridium sp. 1xD42-85]